MIVNGRTYRWPERPVVVVCLDGSALEYIERAIAAGVAPFFDSLVQSGRLLLADGALPSFTNPNNASIVTGVSPAVHGISGNFFLDRSTGAAVMMNDGSFLRAETIPAAFSRAGARVVIVTAKDKLRRLLCHQFDRPVRVDGSERRRRFTRPRSARRHWLKVYACSRPKGPI